MHIDAQCLAPTALDVAADGVTVKGVAVSRGTLHTVAVENRTRVKLTDLFVSEGPSFLGCGGVPFGIDVFNSTDMSIVGCSVSGDPAPATPACRATRTPASTSRVSPRTATCG